MNVKRVGYYKEMPQGINSTESIYDYINKEDSTRIKNICHYLESGVELVVTPEIVNDIIHPENGIAGIASTYTDGMWIWPGDLAYYVKVYKLKLPDEFVSIMEQRGWNVDISVDDIDLSDIVIDGEQISLG